jgi:hypothetical protein
MPDRREGLANSPEHHVQKCKEAAHASLVSHPSIQPSLDICPMWTDVIREEVRELHLSPVPLAWELGMPRFMLVLYRCLLYLLVYLLLNPL